MVCPKTNGSKLGVAHHFPGLPLSGLQQIGDSHLKVEASNQTSGAKQGGHVDSLEKARGPNSIILLRRRMLYSKITRPSKETVPFGLGVTRRSTETTHFILY